MDSLLEVILAPKVLQELKLIFRVTQEPSLGKEGELSMSRTDPYTTLSL